MDIVSIAGAFADSRGDRSRVKTRWLNSTISGLRGIEQFCCVVCARMSNGPEQFVCQSRHMLLTHGVDCRPSMRLRAATLS